MNERADRIARLLRAGGGGTDTLVALLMVKSCDLFAAMLGILKSGAGYVPIDPKFPGRTHPSNRRGCRYGNCSNRPNTRSDCRRVGGEDYRYRRGLAGCRPGSVPTPTIVTPRDICYVIYTSGSTGRPKGIIIEHRNAVNFVRALRTVYKVTEDDRIYQGFSVAFDASIEEIWAVISVGATLVVPSEEVARSVFDAAEFIAQVDFVLLDGAVISCAADAKSTRP